MPTVYQSFDKDGRPHPRWRFKYVDHLGVRRTGTGTTSKRETDQLAMRVQSQQDEIRKGWAPVPKVSDTRRPIKDVVDEYLAWGQSQGGRHGRPWSAKHYETRKRHLLFWISRLELEWLSDLNGSLAEVEAALREKQILGLSGKTLSNIAESICAFCDWAVDRDLLEKDPLRKLAGFDMTPRRRRRAFTVEELTLLLAVSTADHRLAYLVAVTSGLRRRELRSLKRCHLDPVHKGLLLDSAWTKNGKATFQPLPGDVFDLLWNSTTAKAPEERILHVHHDSAGMIAADLAKAGIPRVTSDGILDFHSLRVTYTTLVIEVGASVKEAQTLVRHSSPDLTMNVYARTRSERLTEVVNKVGDVVASAGNGLAGVQRTGAPPTEGAASPAVEAPSAPAEGGGDAGANPASVVGQSRTHAAPESAQLGPEPVVTEGVHVARRTELAFSGMQAGHEICPTGVQQEMQPVNAGFVGFKNVPPPTRQIMGFSGFSAWSPQPPETSGFSGAA